MSDNLDLGVTSALILPTPRATPAELLALAQGRAPDPSAFDGALPFFYSAEISSSRLRGSFCRPRVTSRRASSPTSSSFPA